MTIKDRMLFVSGFTIAMLIAQDQPWKTKPVAEWNHTDAATIFSASPWCKSTVPVVDRPAGGRQRGQGGVGRGGRMGGVGIGGIGGMGGGRMGGRGSGMGSPSSQPESDTGTPDSARATAPALNVLWESALPVQEAHLKLGDSSGPMIDEAFYTIAISTLPRRYVPGDTKEIEKRLKTEGELRREGQKTLHSTDAEIIQNENGMVILFKFPRSAEITKRDLNIQFYAHIGSVTIAQDFVLADMLFDGRLEL